MAGVSPLGAARPQRRGWKVVIIAMAAVSALVFGFGIKNHPQRPVLHALFAPVAQIR